MGVTIKHAFTNPKLDGPDPTLTRPSDWNAAHVITGDGFMIAGQVIDYLGHTVPTYLLEAYGQSVAAVTYPLLFAAMVKQATITLTTGTPGTVNWTGHGLPINSKVRFRTTGGLPTGITANTDYFIISAGYGANSFRIATTQGGSAIDLGGSQSGVHTGVNAQYGVSNDLSTFTVPDLRGRVTAGLDSMGGTAAGRLTGASGGVSGLAVGNVGGLETHTLTLPQSPAHQHNNNPPAPTVDITGLTVTVNSGGAHTHTVTGNVDSNGAHTHTVTGTVDAGGGHTHTVNSATGVTGSGGGFTPAGSIGNESAHTHSIDPPITTSTAAGAAAAHTHTIPILSGTTDTEAAHTHGPGTLGTDTEAAHTHGPGTLGGTTGNSAVPAGSASNFAAGGSKVGLIPVGGDPETIGNHNHSFTVTTGATASGGSHNHAVTTGATASGGSHAHTVSTTASNTGSGGSGLDHTHDVNIAAFTSAAGSAHTHSFTGTPVAAHTHTVTIDSAAAHTHTFSAGATSSAGAHVHTFSSGLAASGGAHTHTTTIGGTVTSALADFLSDVQGGGGAHNNVQPTFILRKLVYVG